LRERGVLEDVARVTKEGVTKADLQGIVSKTLSRYYLSAQSRQGDESFTEIRQRVRLRAAAVAAAYRDRQLTVKQCAAMFGVSRTTIMKFLAAEGVTVRSRARDLDERAVAAAYRDERLSLHDCAARFGISERRVAAVLDRQGVPRRPVGRPPRRPP
jgi:AraC-like DNA-binding protein